MQHRRSRLRNAPQWLMLFALRHTRRWLAAAQSKFDVLAGWNGGGSQRNLWPVRVILVGPGPGAVQLRAEKFHPHFPISTAHPDPAFAQPLDNDQRRGKSHPRCELPSPDAPEHTLAIAEFENVRFFRPTISKSRIAPPTDHRRNIIANSVANSSLLRQTQSRWVSLGTLGTSAPLPVPSGRKFLLFLFPVWRDGFFEVMDDANSGLFAVTTVCHDLLPRSHNTHTIQRALRKRGRSKVRLGGSCGGLPPPSRGRAGHRGSRPHAF